MLKQLLVVGLGGAIGSICRYLLQLFANRHWAIVFPAGTLIVNITGCLLIGILYGVSMKYANISQEWRLFLITGICGGYTTFSSFSYESIELFRQSNYVYFFTYISLSVILGLLATAGGILIIR